MPTEDVKMVVALSNESKRGCIQNLRKLLSDDEKLNMLESNDSYLERYLYATDFNIQKAFKRIKLFYDLLEQNPDWFTVTPPLDKKDIIEKEIRILTPVYDREGRRVYIVKIGNMSSKTMDLTKDVVAVDDFFMELLLENLTECQKGLSIIVDIINFPWNLLRWLTPSNIKVVIRRIQTMPIKEYKYHVVNSSLPVHAAVNIIWPFLPSQIKDGVMFHFNDWEALHEHIDPEVLPPEYGGTGQIDSRQYHDEIMSRSEEIANNFKMNREAYLKKIENLTNK